MLNVKILARRTPRGASLWFFDPIGIAVLLATGAFVLLMRPDPWWLSPFIMAAASFWTTRVRISADNPTRGTAVTFCTVVPVRRRMFDPRKIVVEHDYDEGNPDEITDGAWSFSCHRADAIAQWIHDAHRQLATPTASVRNPDG
jgi:hypothetical protein